MADELRPITVGGVRFRWRFDGRLVVTPAGRSGPPLYVEWGWRDWLEPEGPGAEPVVVTPRFVAAAVRFATTLGWPSPSGGPPVRLTFQNGTFLAVAS
jgi:hypothetical protein